MIKQKAITHLVLRAADLQDLSKRHAAHEATLRQLAHKAIAKVVELYDLTPQEAAELLARRGH